MAVDAEKVRIVVDVLSMGMRFVRISLIGVLATAFGCTGISIAPSCPNELQVGATAPVVGNVLNPGAVPKYAWTVDPPGAGSFVDSTMPNTSFTAETEGMATVTLTASDGLYQVISTCHIQISAAPTGAPSVQLSSAPARPTAGSLLTLTCITTSDIPVATFEITQTAGAELTLANASAGVATATPGDAGDYSFQCIGTGADGTPSDPATLTITVAAGSKPGGRGQD